MVRTVLTCGQGTNVYTDVKVYAGLVNWWLEVLLLSVFIQCYIMCNLKCARVNVIIKFELVI